MYFRFGSFTFPLNTIRIDGMGSRTIYEGLMPVGQSRTWSIYGKLYGSTEADLNNKIRINDQVFAEGGAAIFLNNSGAPTAHHLGSVGSRNGCKVISRPSYEACVGIEMSRIRSFRVELQADYDVPMPGLVVRFQEQISIQGDGGPEEDWLECVIGKPIHQVLKQYTKVVITQTGTIVGRYQLINPRSWVQEAAPGYKMRNLSSETPGTAEIRDGAIGNPVELNFPYSYTWVFKAPGLIIPQLNHWRN